MLERAMAFLPTRVAQAEPLLRRWVEQSSYTADVKDVNAMGRLLLDAFAETGMRVQVEPGREYGDHLGLFTPAWDSGASRVLLVGHHDTVFPRGSFVGYRRDGELARGPGVLDMKGGLVTVRTALCALADAGVLAELPVGLICVADEEVGSPESAAFTATNAKGATAALVFEAGRAEDAIITRRKGTGSVQLRVRGKAAHAGNQHADGVNAIWALSRIVDRVQALTDYQRGVTVNVGTIAGGTSKNTVPAEARIEIDLRFETAADGDRVVAEIETLAQQVAAEFGAHAELGGGIRRPPLERTDASVALFQRYAVCARAAGLGAPEAGLLGGGSDANNVAALGVPAIDGLGPRGRGFHTHDEFIEVPSLALRSEALLRFLLDLAPSTA
ncbi:MAG: M20 family metallopeptidase [Polyangiaceae bacterium]